MHYWDILVSLQGVTRLINMYLECFLVLLVCGFSYQTSRKYQTICNNYQNYKHILASYIKPCNKEDRKCYIEHGNNVIKHIINGDKSLKLSSVNPMKIQQVSATAKNLSLEFNNIEAYGLDTTEIVDVE